MRHNNRINFAPASWRRTSAPLRGAPAGYAKRYVFLSTFVRR